MTMPKQQVTVVSLKVLDLTARIRPQVKEPCWLRGPVKFASEHIDKLSSSFLAGISSKAQAVGATGNHRSYRPSQIRKLCTGGEHDLEGREGSKFVIGDEVAAVEGRQRLPRYDPAPDGGLQGKFFHRRSGWPWISVIPCEATGYIGRVEKPGGVGKKQSTRQPKNEGAQHASESLYPLIHRDPGVGNLLNLLPMSVPLKICFLLGKYGWTAHTLLELRTLIAQGTKLKPRQVFDVLSRQRDADLAYNFLQWALTEANLRLHIKCFTVVLTLVGRVRKYELLENLLKDLDSRGYMLDKIIFTAAMRCYAGGQRMQEALELFIKMKEKGFKPDCVTYSVLIQMFSKAKLYHEALKLYEEMLAQGVATDTQLYNCVVSTFGKAGRLDLAYKKLEEMRERGHIPDQFTYGVLLEGYAKAGRLEFMDLYREMQTAGVPFNEVIFNTMFLAIQRIGNLHDAEVVFADMERVGLSSNLNAFATLIGMCSKKGDAEGAQHWFDRMTRLGLQPTLAIGNSLLDSYARAKQFGHAVQILSSYETWKITPNLPTLTVCLRCLSLCERTEDLEMVQKMLSCHSGYQFLSVLLDRSAEKNVAPVISAFLSTLHFERRQNRREFVNILINYLYHSGYRSRAYQVWEGALANFVFPALVEQGAEGICSINLKDMECGTAVVAIMHILPRLAKQFHRIEMTPVWVQIYTAHVTDEIPPQDPTSVHHAVDMLLQTLHSPFRVDTLQTGGGFVCRGEEVSHWLDRPEIRAMLAFKN